MSKTKSISLEQENTMKEMVVRGVQPQKIADHFKIGISTVHNYKRQFKQDGLQFESVRGRQAAGQTIPATAINRTNSVEPRTIQPSGGVKQPSAQVQPGSSAGNTFVVNGTSVVISGAAKSININKTDAGGIVFEVNL